MAIQICHEYRLRWWGVCEARCQSEIINLFSKKINWFLLSVRLGNLFFETPRGFFLFNSSWNFETSPLMGGNQSRSRWRCVRFIAFTFSYCHRVFTGYFMRSSLFRRRFQLIRVRKTDNRRDPLANRCLIDFRIAPSYPRTKNDSILFFTGAKEGVIDRPITIVSGARALTYPSAPLIVFNNSMIFLRRIPLLGISDGYFGILTNYEGLSCG